MSGLAAIGTTVTVTGGMTAGNTIYVLRDAPRLRKTGDRNVAEETRVFQQKLKELTELAQKHDMRLSTKQVKKHFRGQGLKAKQLRMVYTYLDQLGIEVYDPDLEDASASREKRRSVLEAYLEEIDAIGELPEKEEFAVFERAAAGDREAKNILIERYLTTVCDLAGEMEKKGSGPEPEDLVQEANIGLVLAADCLEKEDTLAAYRVKLLRKVSDYLEESLKQFEEIRHADDRVVSRMNRLADTIHELEEELGHKPSIEEVSAYLSIPVQELSDMLRLGGEDLKIEDV